MGGRSALVALSVALGIVLASPAIAAAPEHAHSAFYASVPLDTSQVGNGALSAADWVCWTTLTAPDWECVPAPRAVVPPDAVAVEVVRP